jgi:mRNA interferase RelE/StbE
MPYQIVIKRTAEKELDALSSGVRDRIAVRLLRLEENPRPSGCLKLQGQDGYRLRVGDYRVLHSVDDRAQLIIIFAIGHRREVYK